MRPGNWRPYRLYSELAESGGISVKGEARVVGAKASNGRVRPLQPVGLQQHVGKEDAQKFCVEWL